MPPASRSRTSSRLPSQHGATRKWLGLAAESVNAGTLPEATTGSVPALSKRLNAVSHMWIAGKSLKLRFVC